jgi:hypothetical protein
MSSVGDEQAFPVPGMSKTTKNGTLCLTPIPGMTYRMWLFGEILAGLSANPNVTGELGREEIIDWASDQTEMAISSLEAHAAYRAGRESVKGGGQ